MYCQYIDMYMKPADTTLYLRKCMSVAINKLDTEGSQLNLCSKHTNEIQKKMLLGGREVEIIKLNV